MCTTICEVRMSVYKVLGIKTTSNNESNWQMLPLVKSFSASCEIQGRV